MESTKQTRINGTARFLRTGVKGEKPRRAYPHKVAYRFVAFPLPSQQNTQHKPHVATTVHACVRACRSRGDEKWFIMCIFYSRLTAPNKIEDNKQTKKPALHSLFLFSAFFSLPFSNSYKTVETPPTQTHTHCEETQQTEVKRQNVELLHIYRYFNLFLALPIAGGLFPFRKVSGSLARSPILSSCFHVDHEHVWGQVPRRPKDTISTGRAHKQAVVCFFGW